MLGIGTDVFTHMPAALALRMFQRRRDDLFGFILDDCGRRAYEDKFQVVTERSQGVVLLAGAADLDPALTERRVRLGPWALGLALTFLLAQSFVARREAT